MTETEWVRVATPTIPEGRVTTVVAGDRAVCLVHGEDGAWSALDNRCPHQGGPLGDGQLDDGWLICPWHAYQYDPRTGEPPPGFRDAATPYAVRVAPTATRPLEIEVPGPRARRSLMDQVVDVLCDWGLEAVFGMVGHSNLGMADALRKAEADGRLTYVGIRHEGAAAFAASGYAKLTGNPAACFSIAGPGATNLLTGLWDAKVDRIPILALTGQVQTQVIGPGTFQELPLEKAFDAVAEWSQTILSPANATELAALAMKHAIVQRDVAHLVLPDDVQELPGVDDPPPRPRAGSAGRHRHRPARRRAGPRRRAAPRRRAPGHRRSATAPAPTATRCMALAEHLDAPVISTFKAKGTFPDDHPLGCGVLGRSGIPVASQTVAQADCLLVLGASFSNHTSIPTWVPTIQVDLDRMILGKFHPVEVPLWGDIARTIDELLAARCPRVDRPDHAREGRHPVGAVARREGVAARPRRRPRPPPPRARVRGAQRAHARRRRHRRRRRQQHLQLRALLRVPRAARTCSCPATSARSASPCPPPSARRSRCGGPGSGRKVVSISGDGGLGQYLAEVTTAVKEGFPLTHVVLDNGELAKISREQLGAIRPVWQTHLVNPDFAEFATSCGAAGLLGRARPTSSAPRSRPRSPSPTAPAS